MEIAQSNREVTESQSRLPFPDISIPGYELLRQIAEGTFGAVWLAKHIETGTYRALKVISQKAGRSQREIAGLLTYERLAVSHPGLVQILDLHVGGSGLSYYAMELADDLNTGTTIDPASYLPKTLTNDIRQHGRKAVVDCLKVCESLLEALDQLHQHGVIHRDIKPSNIIFIKGRPKLADIGLITEVGGTLSYAGTEGYIPPEGPSSKQADIFAFGKVLYEMSTGQERGHYPVFPPDIDKAPDALAFLELNEIVVRASEVNTKVRYHSVPHLCRDLAHLRQGGSIRQLRVIERRKRQAKVATVVGAASVILATAVLVPVYLDNHHKEAARNQRVGAFLNEAIQAMNRQDMSAALSPLVEALSISGHDAAEEEFHRLRINAVLDQAPSILQLWFGPKRYNHVRFNHDASKLLATQFDGVAELFDLRSGERILTLDNSYGLEIAEFDGTGNRILTAGQNKIVRVWNAHTCQKISELQHTSRVYSASFHPTNSNLVLFACLNGYAWLWDIKEGGLVKKFGEGDGQLFYAGFSPDGALVVTAGTNRMVRIWNAQTTTLIGEPLRHSSWVFSAAFSPDGSLLATASADRTAQLWDVATQRKVGASMIHANAVRSVEFSPDGQTLVTASWDGTVRLWDINNTQPLSLNPVLYHSDGVMHATFARHGRYLATACIDKTLRVWDLAASIPEAITSTGEVMRDSRVTANLDKTTNSRSIKELISSDGSLRATRNGKIVEVVSTKNGSKVFTTPKHRSPVKAVAFSHNSRLLVTATGDGNFEPGIAQIWDVTSGQPLGRPLAHRDGIIALVFNDDDSILATCSEDCTLALWSVETSQQLGPRLQHDDQVLAAAFNSDGKLLATVCADKSVRMWHTLTGQPLTPKLQCSRLPKSIRFEKEETLTIRSGHELASWTLSPTPFSKSQLAAWSELLHPTTTNTLSSLAEGWKIASRSVVAPSSTLSAIAWHNKHLAAYRTASKWRACLFHIDELLTFRPRDEELLSIRDEILLKIGRSTTAPTQITSNE